jgi:hypothetical protein
VARQTGQAAIRSLTSPWTLAGAAAIGFLIAMRFQHRSHEPSPNVSKRTKEKAKGGAIASVAMAAASWLVKSQFGSPVQMAQFFLSKVKTIKKHPPQPVRSSPRSDRAMATTRR